MQYEQDNGQDNSVKWYFNSIAKYDLLTVEEEVEIAKKIKEGCEDSLDKLVNCNLRLVVSIAHQFKSNGAELMDLICEGNIGLMKAAKKFDPSKGAKFSSYASWWIKQMMRRHIAEHISAVRIPIQSQSKIKQIKKYKKDFLEKNGRNPYDQEIADATDYSLKTISHLKPSLKFKLESLDSIFQDIESDSVHKRDVIVNDYLSDKNDAWFEKIDNDEKMEWVNKMLTPNSSRKKDFFNARNCKIFKMRYGIGYDRGHKLEEISKEVGCTRERVRQICVEMVRRMVAKAS